MSWWLTLALGPLPEDGRGGAPYPPDEEHEGVSRLATPAGEAAIVLHLARTRIAEGEMVEFWLVNCGQVALISGQHFRVERWSGSSWTVVPPPRVGGHPLMFTDEGWLLEPGARTPIQVWPFRGSTVRPGWYRLVKSAAYEGGHAYGQRGTDRTELAARARLRVDARL